MVLFILNCTQILKTLGLLNRRKGATLKSWWWEEASRKYPFKRTQTALHLPSLVFWDSRCFPLLPAPMLRGFMYLIPCNVKTTPQDKISCLHFIDEEIKAAQCPVNSYSSYCLPKDDVQDWLLDHSLFHHFTPFSPPCLLPASCFLEQAFCSFC